MVLRVLVICLVLVWVALGFLGTVDLKATARLFSALEAPIIWAKNHV